jgi:hypothetical protein
MIVRDALVQSTYYYLRAASNDNPARRADRHQAFVDELDQMLRSLSGWLSIPTPSLPAITMWEDDPPLDPHLLVQCGELQGRVNASGWLYAYVLRDMLLMRVVVARPGEHDQTVWSMLDESLSNPPIAASWLHTTRYWCGIAPRPPEDLEQERSLPIKTPFGVLCLGHGATPHLLVYPDARTESRASMYLGSLASQLDWYPVQSRYQVREYDNRIAGSVRNQQNALETVAHSIQDWSTPGIQKRLRSLAPLQTGLNMLEMAYEHVVEDRTTTEAVTQHLESLVLEYRLTLMQSGLWDAAPTVWQAQVDQLELIHTRLGNDLRYIDATLRRVEMMIRTVQTRTMILQGERERLLVYMIAVFGVAILAVLVADTNVGNVLVRLLALVIIGAAVWIGWQRWLRSHVP